MISAYKIQSLVQVGLVLLASHLELGLITSASANEQIAGDEVVVLAEDGVQVTLADVRQALAPLTEKQQKELLAGPAAARDLVERLYRDQVLLADAREAGIPELAAVQSQIAQAERDLILNAWRERFIAELAPPDFDALAEEVYLTDPDAYQAPERYRVAHILLRADPSVPCNERRNEIEGLQQKLREGADFAALAREHSEDRGSAERGGELEGWVAADELERPFAVALSKLGNEELSGIVETRYGYHVIKRLDYRPPEAMGFEEVRDGIVQELRDTYKERAFQQYWVRARPSSAAIVNEDALTWLVEQGESPALDE